MQLLIPKPQETKYLTYKVKQGDTLYTIALSNNTTVTELKNLNNLTSNTLSIGQTLLLPTKTMELSPDTTTYTVKSGDNLYTISRIYNVSVDDLKKANNLTTNILSIGQTLLIPTPSKTTIYTVKSGDSLYSIARTYNTTVAELKKRNNLTTNILTIGQKLII